MSTTEWLREIVVCCFWGITGMWIFVGIFVLSVALVLLGIHGLVLLFT